MLGAIRAFFSKIRGFFDFQKKEVSPLSSNVDTRHIIQAAKDV